MIFIKEIFSGNRLVTIRVEGILDRESIPILKETCEHHFMEEGRKVFLDLKGLIHISREGRIFLREIQKKVVLVKTPPLLTLEGQISR